VWRGPGVRRSEGTEDGDSPIDSAALGDGTDSRDWRCELPPTSRSCSSRLPFCGDKIGAELAIAGA
jgi:hypothetical protein